MAAKHHHPQKEGKELLESLLQDYEKYLREVKNNYLQALDLTKPFDHSAVQEAAQKIIQSLDAFIKSKPSKANLRRLLTEKQLLPHMAIKLIGYYQELTLTSRDCHFLLEVANNYRISFWNNSQAKLRFQELEKTLRRQFFRL